MIKINKRGESVAFLFWFGVGMLIFAGFSFWYGNIENNQYASDLGVAFLAIGIISLVLAFFKWRDEK